MASKFRDGQSLDIAVAADVAVGDFVQIGDLCFNVFSKPTATTAVGRTTGVYKVAKKSGDALTIGQKVYYDAANKNFTTTAGSRRQSGVAAAVATGAATEGQVLLNGLPGTFGP